MTDTCEIDLTLGPVEPILLSLAEAQPIELSVDVASMTLDLSAAPVELSVDHEPIVLQITGVGVQGPPGLDGTSNVDQSLISLHWDSPTPELFDVIEITGSLSTLAGDPLVSSIVDLEIIVTDGAIDGEPSHTAFLTSASTPVGIVLAGSGTATLLIRSEAGSISIAVHEAISPCKRYLWIKGAGHQRLWARAADGIQELSFD